MLQESSMELEPLRLLSRFSQVRDRTIALCAPLSPEDLLVQSMPDASPAKWHMAHTSWFFETFVLIPSLEDYRPFHVDFSFLFNSYYNAIGERVARHRRGLMTRPSSAEIIRYREHVDGSMKQLFEQMISPSLGGLVELGLQHEQQHQELILTDILHALAQNSLKPVYQPREPVELSEASPLGWVEFEAGVRSIGHSGGGFAFDNEGPRHRVFLEPFAVADRLTTNGEFVQFMEDGGYQRSELWLSDGWATRISQGWEAPLYWERSPDGWKSMGLSGFSSIDLLAPVTHVSYYEADAFARWSGARLATEAEWEVACEDQSVVGNFVESGRLEPVVAVPSRGLRQMFGDAWEWTGSAYLAYPGYRPALGALGEYNGKFMCNQFVLRGGSCASPRTHLRATYRNFFPPDARWQFSGIRLARSCMPSE